MSLTSLSCTVKLSPPSRLFLGSSLRSLEVYLSYDVDIAAANEAIVVISQLPQLTDLTLEQCRLLPEMSFAPLASAAQLVKLNLQTGDAAEPTRAHLDQLRMLPHLRVMLLADLNQDDLEYLLRAPHALQWQEIHPLHSLDDIDAASLSTLPSLTSVGAHLCRSVAFLPALIRLRSIVLSTFRSANLAADVAAGLSRCSQLTELSLMVDDVTSKHMSQALSHLPLLRSLTLMKCSALESLSFLSECAHLAQSLQSLKMIDCNNAALHSTELKHILTLKSLTSLDLERVFVEWLDACTQALLTPPSLELENLEQFRYRT